MSWWWLSFVDPATKKWLGCTVVRAASAQDAVSRSHMLGVNPGGQVGIQGVATDIPPPTELLEKLVTDRVDAKVLGRRWTEAMGNRVRLDEVVN